MNKSKSANLVSKPILNDILPLINELTKTNGPDPAQYQKMTQLMGEIGTQRKKGEIGQNEIHILQKAFGEAMTTNHTLQGLVCVKPHGYAGDYEIIDKIYTNHLNPHEKFIKWDKYFQSRSAPKAVRNRKEFFKNWLAQKKRPLSVLSLVGGPCRDLLEFLEDNPDADIQIDTVEYDPNAITYAKKLFEEAGVSMEKISFINATIFKYTPTKRYDAIWSSGMFDYLNNEAFVMALKKLVYSLEENGELVLGNFQKGNPTRDYMDFGEWFLNYRTDKELIALAKKAGIQEHKIGISKESLGINLFLHVKK